ncbi:MAG: bifunctional shikimate kinase/3-dehydroquinate synthase [Kofleriaceae bacterium]|nr:bifunctional shikimate kinase/3-dehydroquinate synthase [Kofleriaceae bacterium]
MTRSIFLIGFMAVGKTTVGRALADHLGWRFVDLDDVIAAAAGAPVAGLVAADEPDFRRRERAALAALCAQAAAGGLVVATGGGCAAHADNVEHMRAAGLVVALTAELAEVRRRAAGGPARPLLGDDAGAAALLAARLPAYRRAHATVPTDGATVAEVVGAIAAAAAASATVPLPELAATVALGARSYPVRVSPALPDAGVLAALAGASRIAVVIDGNVAARWSAPLAAALPGLGPSAAWHVVAPGEASKSIASYQALCDALVAAGLDRGSALVAIGGGVVGDLAGFVAATLFRGVPVVHLPTTIVAMTDSAIGGKTGLDLAAGKNLVGAFWQPRLVSAHLPLLATLPGRERRAGFGELWKYGLLTGGGLWDLVAAHAGWAAGADDAPVPTSLTEVITRAAASKAWVVSVDEREQTGQRLLLNLGHTVGHAIEAEHGLAHGEAVGLGLVAACVVSHALGLAPADLAGEVAARLRTTGLAADPRAYLNEPALARLGVDKKRAGTRVRFVAVHDVGRCAPIDVEVDELRRILRSHPAV